MPLHSRAAMAALLIATGATAAPAQAPGAASAPAVPAASPAASIPGSAYRSAFDGYRRFSEQPVAPWKASNDRVAEIGGWKAYAREAAGEDHAAPPVQRTAPAEPPPPGHHDHQKP